MTESVSPDGLATLMALLAQNVALMEQLLKSWPHTSLEPALLHSDDDNDDNEEDAELNKPTEPQDEYLHLLETHWTAPFHLRQTTTVLMYWVEFCEHMLPFKTTLSERQVCFAFVRGLKDDICQQMSVQKKCSGSLDSLFEEARYVESEHDMIRARRGPTRSRRRRRNTREVRDS